MQLSTNLEKIFYNYVRVNPELLSIVTPDFFQTKEIKECYAFDEKFYKKYTQIPTYTQMVNMILTKSEQENLEDDEITAIINIMESSTIQMGFAEKALKLLKKFKEKENGKPK